MSGSSLLPIAPLFSLEFSLSSWRCHQGFATQLLATRMCQVYLLAFTLSSTQLAQSKLGSPVTTSRPQPGDDIVGPAIAPQSRPMIALGNQAKPPPFLDVSLPSNSPNCRVHPNIYKDRSIWRGWSLRGWLWLGGRMWGQTWFRFGSWFSLHVGWRNHLLKKHKTFKLGWEMCWSSRRWPCPTSCVFIWHWL